jgi:Heavy metal associated domain 2/ABC 3 transport family
MRRPREAVSRPRAGQSGVRVRSAVPGRMRWEAEVLRGRPRKAAAVELALRQIVGIISAEVTPRTGRLLVRYDIGLTEQWVAAMVQASLHAQPFTHGTCEIPPKQGANYQDGGGSIVRTDMDTQHHSPLSNKRPQWGHWRLPLVGCIALTHRMPVHLQGMLFALLLALAMAQSWLASGLLLVLSLVITPMAAAGLLTAQPTRLVLSAVGLAVWSAWLGLWLAAKIVWMPSAFMAISSFALYLGVRWLVVNVGSDRRRSAWRRCQLTQQQPWSRIDLSVAQAAAIASHDHPMLGN